MKNWLFLSTGICSNDFHSARHMKDLACVTSFILFTSSHEYHHHIPKQREMGYSVQVTKFSCGGQRGCGTLSRKYGFSFQMEIFLFDVSFQPIPCKLSQNTAWCRGEFQGLVTCHCDWNRSRGPKEKVQRASKMIIFLSLGFQMKNRCQRPHLLLSRTSLFLLATSGHGRGCLPHSPLALFLRLRILLGAG